VLELGNDYSGALESICADFKVESIHLDERFFEKYILARYPPSSAASPFHSFLLSPSSLLSLLVAPLSSAYA
jgi:hypothetical protein